MDAARERALARFVAESPLDRRHIAGWVRRTAAEAAAGTRVLDAGAGESPYASLFAHCAYTSTDWSGSVHPGSARADVVAPLDHLPLPDGAFDLVLCTQVLEHVEDPPAVLAELRRVLRPGGRLALTVPFVGELHEEPHDHFRYTRHGLAGLLMRAGFDRVTVRPFGGYYTTLAQVLRNGALATGVGAGDRSLGRLVTAGLRVAGTVLPPLDRLDRRRALPLGYGVHAEASARS